jgi:hypothetical protein
MFFTSIISFRVNVKAIYKSFTIIQLLFYINIEINLILFSLYNCIISIDEKYQHTSMKKKGF